MARPLLSLLCLLSVTGAIPTDRCIIPNKRCNMHDNLISSIPGVTGPQCKELCRNVDNCSAYTHFGPDSFPFQDMCMLFSYCDALDDCEDCVTASVRLDCSCGITYEGPINYENLVRFEVDILTELECRRLCSDDISCKVYTYYNEDHATDKNLCMLLKEMQNPIVRCENCQTAPQKCEAFDECIVGFYEDGEGNMILPPKGLLVTESSNNVMRYVSGEEGCYKTVTGLAVGSGGSGGYSGSSDYGAGGGSGHINTSQLSVPANTAISVDMSGTSTTVTVQNTGQVLLRAEDGESVSGGQYGADGYSGGGGSGYSSVGGDGGTGGGDGENGYWNGGNGSGFDITSVDLKHYQLSAGRGGKHDGSVGGSYFAGGGGGVIVDGVGPDGGDRVGEGYGGGGPGDSSSTVRSGSPGCVILEL